MAAVGGPEHAAAGGGWVTLAGAGEGYAYKERQDLRRVRVAGGTARIGGFAFSDCKAVEEVVVPRSVTEIADYAFAGCSALRRSESPSRTRAILRGIVAGAAFGHPPTI